MCEIQKITAGKGRSDAWTEEQDGGHGAKVGHRGSRCCLETAGAYCRHSRRSVQGKSCQGISRCHKSHRQLPGGSDQPTFCYPAFFFFFLNSLMMQLRHFSARNGCVVMSRWVWYQCEITRSRLVTGGGRKRISGPVEGECGLPAVGNQLVRGSVSPAPSASHLLSPLGALVNLSTSHSSQRLCHSVLSSSYDTGDRK